MKLTSGHFCVILLMCCSFSSFAQIKTPDKTEFNVGVFSGLGGVNITPIPGVDLQYKSTILRVAPGYRAVGAGFIKEVLPLSKAFYNWYWIVSLYGTSNKEDGKFAANSVTTYKKGILLSGFKVYFGKRWYSQIQGGVAYSKGETSGFTSIKEWMPYFEFCLGINLFKNFKNEPDDQE